MDLSLSLGPFLLEIFKMNFVKILRNINFFIKITCNKKNKKL